MPTVLRIDAFRFVIYLNDHSPPHVHVFTADAEARIELGQPGGFPRLLENRHMKPMALAKALALVKQHQDALVQAWSRLHG
jgi:hypothetical protein